jgi:glyoxylase I family protein
MPNNGTNATLHGGGFHHIAIRAFDFDETLKFYCEGLGLKRTHGWGKDERAEGGKDSRAALLDTGDGNYIEVFAGRAACRPDSDPEDALLHFALRTTNTDEALERARAAGATVTMEPKSVTPSYSERPLEFRIAFVRGPNGEIIEFFHNDEL